MLVFSLLAIQLRHYEWNPPEIWSRSAQEHNWERWRQKLSLIQKSEAPAVVSGSTVGFQLGAGTEHELVSHAVEVHIARWRERTRTHFPAASARTVMAPCKVVSVDAEDDGSLNLNVSSSWPSNSVAQVLVNGIAASSSPLPLNRLRISSPTTPGMYFVAVHKCSEAQHDCASIATCGATFVVE